MKRILLVALCLGFAVRISRDVLGMYIQEVGFHDAIAP